MGIYKGPVKKIELVKKEKRNFNEGYGKGSIGVWRRRGGELGGRK